MCGYYRIVCHENMPCSGNTKSHICNKNLAKNAKKTQIIPKLPQKQKKILPEETLKRENQHKMTHVRSKRQQRQKQNKRVPGSVRYYSRTGSNLLGTSVSDR